MKRLCLQLSITGMAVLICLGSQITNASKEYATLNSQPAWIASANSPLSGESETGNSILYKSDGGVACRRASAREARLLSRRDSSDQLRRITPADEYSAQQKGLQIVLRATQQLQNSPEAGAAFLKAASIWTDKIQSPVTIIVDVDFGPTRFGEQWGAQVLGSTSPQEITSDAYRAVRAQLIAGAPDDQARDIFNSLPIDTMPTDIGNTITMRAPAANARALGLLDPVADPDGKEKKKKRTSAARHPSDSTTNTNMISIRAMG
jgi:hypothetical protein